MPKREDIKSILIIGAGPIVIGQACEFDYSGTQAAKALKEEGYKIILVNSNPATIMTDPEIADKTYIEPITVEYVLEIIKKENPDAILPTVGGQTALNLVIELHDKGILDKYDVELIGAQIDAIQKAEDREKFKEAMEKVSIKTAKGDFIYNWEEAKRLLTNIVNQCYLIVGNYKTVIFLDDLKDLGFNMATQSGLSISVSDVLIPHEKDNILSMAFDKVLPKRA